MGWYFNPADRDSIQKTGGRHLSDHGFDHGSLVAELRPEERLGWFLDRYIFKQMPDVTTPGEFAEFERLVGRGEVRHLGFYAMPKSSFR